MKPSSVAMLSGQMATSELVSTLNAPPAPCHFLLVHRTSPSKACCALSMELVPDAKLSPAESQKLAVSVLKTLAEELEFRAPLIGQPTSAPYPSVGPD